MARDQWEDSLTGITEIEGSFWLPWWAAAVSVGCDDPRQSDIGGAATEDGLGWVRA
jgi:hypothetical protein